MATEVLKMTGTLAWARVYEPDVAFGSTQFKVDFFPADEAEWEKFKKSGIQKTVRENEQGKYFSLTRPEMKMMKGEVVNFTGPVVEDEDGGVIVDYINKKTQKRVFSYNPKEKNDIERRGSPILIGNGSKAEVTVAVYDTFKGKGQRLEKIRILDLVEYQRGDGELPELSKMVSKETPVEDKPEVEKKTDKSQKTPW